MSSIHLWPPLGPGSAAGPGTTDRNAGTDGNTATDGNRRTDSDCGATDSHPSAANEHSHSPDTRTDGNTGTDADPGTADSNTGAHGNTEIIEEPTETIEEATEVIELPTEVLTVEELPETDMSTTKVHDPGQHRYRVHLGQRHVRRPDLLHRRGCRHTRRYRRVEEQ